MVVAIGITGHRVLAEPGKVNAGLGQVVRRLEEAFPGQWTVISALAEGADRLTARRLMCREGTRLVAVLPLARDEYQAGFRNDSSRSEFASLLARADQVIQIPPQPSRDQAYEAGGRAVLDRAEVLVAVWDGEAPQGQGGTGDIIARARQRGLPLAWVHAGNRKPGTLEPASLGDQQGVVSFERLPGATADQHL